MSLIAKIQKQSLLQNKLQAQLAEMSYQAVNGTRQAPRNFREGTLEIGKMHFSTPQDRITKEMIMDYQAREQEKYYKDSGGNKFLYEPTGLSDVLATYTPIPFTPVGYTALGAAVSDQDIRDYKNELNKLYDELKTMKNTELKRKEKYASNSQKQYITSEERVQDKKEDMREIGNEIIAHKERLKEIQDEILMFNSTTSISASPGASSVLNSLKKEEANEQADITSKEKYLNGTLAKELKDLETEAIRLKAVSERYKNE